LYEVPPGGHYIFILRSRIRWQLIKRWRLDQSRYPVAFDFPTHSMPPLSAIAAAHVIVNLGQKERTALA
jgi:hypothetical protein